MTRSFGLVFLGVPRDPTVRAGEDAPGTMFVPMAAHAVGCVLLGLAPITVMKLFRATLDLFPVSTGMDRLTQYLEPLVVASRALGLLIVSVALLRLLTGRHARRSVTWGCGYTAASPRMQYTGSSFVEQFARILEGFLPALRRERLTDALFPQAPGHLSTHHADPVERRMFEVLGQGEDFVEGASERISEQPRFAFAAGLLTLIVIGAIVFGVGHP
jgi:hypothetical protein